MNWKLSRKLLRAAAINNIAYNFNDNAINTIYNFNPVDKIVELY
ncbi:MAG TPA: hypothetical protein VHC47_00135 [Mucilaginibacter sp.]|nr:hypothetical protein [Mucilaginibacter sp.]